MEIHKEERLFETLSFHGTKIPKKILRGFTDLMFSAARDGRLSAGITYLGQFISHDINPSLKWPENTTYGRVLPQLNLDSLYGNEKFQGTAINASGEFLLGYTSDGIYGNDINREGRAPLLAELRNTENYLISQLHLFWLKFHNLIANHYFNHLARDHKIVATRAFVTNVFHQLVVDEFLYQILNRNIFELYCVRNKRFLLGNRRLCAIPQEFTHGVFRFGHSLVRESYNLRADSRKPTNLSKLMVKKPLHRMNKNFIVDWAHFFSRDSTGTPIQRGGFIDMFVPNMMKHIPNKNMEANIVSLNIKADFEHKLPTGPQIVEWIRCHSMTLSESAGLRPGEYHFPRLAGRFKKYRKDLPINRCPLWIYTLLESVATEGGQRLGKLASVIVAEVIMNAIDSTCSINSTGYQNRKLKNTVDNRLVDFYGNIERMDMLTLIKRSNTLAY